MMMIFSLSACFEENDLSGPITPAEMELTVTDANGAAVSGATVDLFANNSDYIEFSNVLATKTTDGQGVVVFSAAEMIDASKFHFSAKSGDLRNWNGINNRELMVSNGRSEVSTSLGAVTLSSAISGPATAISGTTVTLSVAAFPGSYTWSIVSGTNGTIDNPASNEVNIAFDQNSVDEIVTVELSYAPDGFVTQTFTHDILVTAFCPIDVQIIDGALVGGDITIDGLGWPAWNSQVVTTKTGDNNLILVTGLGIGWMEDFWGEVITNMETVNMEVDDFGLYVTIPTQAYMETTYQGAAQDPYTISGSGIIDGCNGTITIEYELTNYGTDWGTWCNVNGYSSDAVFTAVLDLP